MHDPRGVRRAERVADLREDARGLEGRERAAPLHGMREVLALEELHGEPRHAGLRVDARAHHLHHVLAPDARAHARLERELVTQLGAADQAGVHQLERALAAGGELLGDVDGAHPARSEPPDDAVVVGKDASRREVRNADHRAMLRSTLAARFYVPGARAGQGSGRRRPAAGRQRTHLARSALHDAQRRCPPTCRVASQNASSWCTPRSAACPPPSA